MKKKKLTHIQRDNIRAGHEFDMFEVKLCKRANKLGFDGERTEQVIADGIEQYASKREGIESEYGPMGRHVANAITRHEIILGIDDEK